MNDNAEKASEAEMLIKNHEVWVTIEVIAEVIYVLKGVYKVKKREVCNCLLEFLAEVRVDDREVLERVIQTYAECNLDFVDCVLYAYHSIRQYEIKTFDKKLNKLLSQI